MLILLKIETQMLAVSVQTVSCALNFEKFYIDLK